MIFNAEDTCEETHEIEEGETPKKIDKRDSFILQLQDLDIKEEPTKIDQREVIVASLPDIIPKKYKSAENPGPK